MNDITLVSFKTCPFVMRAVATMFQKGLNYKIEYINLQNPPEWFKQQSPLGKVPLLIVGKEGISYKIIHRNINIVIFESTVIMELIDEMNPPLISPADPVRKALNRAYFTIASEI